MGQDFFEIQYAELFDSSTAVDIGQRFRDYKQITNSNLMQVAYLVRFFSFMFDILFYDTVLANYNIYDDIHFNEPEPHIGLAPISILLFFFALQRRRDNYGIYAEILLCSGAVAADKWYGSAMLGKLVGFDSVARLGLCPSQF